MESVSSLRSTIDFLTKSDVISNAEPAQSIKLWLIIYTDFTCWKSFLYLIKTMTTSRFPTRPVTPIPSFIAVIKGNKGYAWPLGIVLFTRSRPKSDSALVTSPSIMLSTMTYQAMPVHTASVEYIYIYVGLREFRGNDWLTRSTNQLFLSRQIITVCACHGAMVPWCHGAILQECDTSCPHPFIVSNFAFQPKMSICMQVCRVGDFFRG